jgi:hypothetical protein
VRIPFPERVPIERVGLFALVLFVVQSLEGTPFYFSVGCFAFILISAFAFNTAGGLSRPSGVYIFCYSLLVVIIGLCYKAFLGERADGNLRAPDTDIKVYVGTAAALFVAVLVSRRFSRRVGLLQGVLRDRDMYRAMVGCFVFSVAAPILLGMLGQGGEKLASAFNQLNQLGALGIIIGVIYEIRRSGGTRSVNLPVLFASAYIFALGGIFGFSKQAMLTPIVCWMVPAAALRYRVSLVQVGGAALFILITFQYLVPYSQYTRSLVRDETSFSERVNISTYYFFHPSMTRALYLEGNREFDEADIHYYDTPQGFWDRLTFIEWDDALNDVTDQGRMIGWLPITASFVNAVPHVFWADKPVYQFGNIYAHEVGGLSEDDMTTGISFSAASEAYHIARWVGVLVVAPAIWVMLFTLYDSLCGGTSTSPWAMLASVMVAHLAPEGALSGAIYLMTFGAEALVFVAFFSAWIAPICSFLVLGPDRKKFQNLASLAGIPRTSDWQDPAAAGDSPRVRRTD